MKKQGFTLAERNLGRECKSRRVSLAETRFVPSISRERNLAESETGTCSRWNSFKASISRKKRAFTLAEVLITLAIIGVIAAISIPTLLQDTGSTKYKTQWKKMYAELSQATQLVLYDINGSFEDLSATYGGTEQGDIALKNAYKNHFNAIKVCDDSSADGCWHSNNNKTKALNGTAGDDEVYSGSGLILANGAFVTFMLNPGVSCQSDFCGVAVVDVNGFAEPNTLGKDLFGTMLGKNSILPYGAGDNPPPTTCIEGSTAANNTGEVCSAQYLYE